MEPLDELRAKCFDRELVGQQALLGAAIFHLSADLPAVRDGIGIRIELTCQAGILQGREVRGFRGGTDLRSESSTHTTAATMAMTTVTAAVENHVKRMPVRAIGTST